MTNWTIRTATDSDADPLARCIDAAYAAARSRISDLPDVSAGIADDIRDHVVMVATLDDRIIGGLVLVPRTDHALLANVAVDPGHAGMGVGRGLIAEAEAECRRRGIPALRLSTHVAMPENVSLYQRLGWRMTTTSGNKVQMTKAIEGGRPRGGEEN